MIRFARTLSTLFVILIIQCDSFAQESSTVLWRRVSPKVLHKTALLKLNGETVTIETMNNVPQNTILSIEALKRKAAKERYGNEAKAGAVVVKTFSPKPFPYTIDSTTDASFFIAYGDTIYLRANTVASIFENTDSTRGWTKFLEKNLNSNVLVDNGAPTGYYAVPVRFIVNKDGTVSDVEILANPGYGAAKEVYRMLSVSSGWQPALYKGQPVRSVVTKTIMFIIWDE